MLSTSDDKNFHLAPAEGMASGAVPAILDWPGADTIYDGHWIHRSTDEIADFVTSVVDEGRWDAERELARAQARDGFALDRVCALWDRLIADPDRVLLDEPTAGRKSFAGGGGRGPGRSSRATLRPPMTDPDQPGARAHGFATAPPERDRLSSGPVSPSCSDGDG